MDKNKHFSCLYIKRTNKAKARTGHIRTSTNKKNLRKSCQKKQVQKRVKTDKRKEKREKSSLFSNNYLQIKVKKKRKE